MNAATQHRDRTAVALEHYRQHYGVATRADIEAAMQRRCFHTLAEITSLLAAGFAIDAAGHVS